MLRFHNIKLPLNFGAKPLLRRLQNPSAFRKVPSRIAKSAKKA